MTMTTVTLFDHFAVDVNMTNETSNVPRELKYREAAPSVRPLNHGLYDPYRVQTIEMPGARVHSDALVESAALATVRPPMPSYRPILEPDIVTRRVLSLEQLETVIYAGEQHRQRFEMSVRTTDGDVSVLYRGGFMLADGAGVGKGRQIAGIIRDNRHHGRNRAVWFTYSSRLIKDTRRDWIDLGGKANDVVAWSKTKTKDALQFDDGILFATYGLLRVKTEQTVVNPENGKSSVVTRWARLEQLVKALGVDFDGVIVFDECHALINAAPKDTDEDSSVSAPSAQGQAALLLQAALPNARIVYVSATAASRLDALAYAERLQMWGVGGPFPNRETFLKEVSDGGTSALEVVARDLKAQGRMVARTLTYEGVQYQRITHELTPDQIKLYNDHNAVCRAIEQGFHKELVALGMANTVHGHLNVEAIPGANVGKRLGNWRGSRLLADRQLLMSLKMPMLIPFIEQQLAEGRAVVIQLTHTNEAALDRALEELEDGESLDTLDLSHREKLLDFLKTSYPTEYHRKDYDPGGKLRAVPTGIHDEGAIKRRDELVASVERLLYPLPGLDELFRHFGHRKIAEVTGRSQQLVWSAGVGAEGHADLRPRGAGENNREIEAFLNDAKQILVFSEGAGGVGESFHSDVRFKNQRRRVHIFLEMSWRAEGAVQGMGRTHRTGQVVPPIYVFASTNVDGEKRFSSTPARKIAALGALSRGQREAADNGLFRAEDNLEGRFGRIALLGLLTAIGTGKVQGIDRDRLHEQTGIDCARHDAQERERKRFFKGLTVAKFLNRMLTSDVGENGGFQHELMNAFMEQMETAIEQAKESGTFDYGVFTYKPDRLQVKRRTVINVTASGAKTEILELEAEDMPDRLTWDQIVKRREDLREFYDKSGRFATDADGHIGFYVDVNHRIEHENPLVRVIGVTGERYTEKADADTHATLMDTAARATWESTYSEVTSKRRLLTAVTGALTPVWMKLPWRNPEVWRTQTDDGERLLMRIIATSEREKAYQQFGVTAVARAA
jgi:hypothetical protein